TGRAVPTDLTSTTADCALPDCHAAGHGVDVRKSPKANWVRSAPACARDAEGTFGQVRADLGTFVWLRSPGEGRFGHISYADDGTPWHICGFVDGTPWHIGHPDSRTLARRLKHPTWVEFSEA